MLIQHGTKKLSAVPPKLRAMPFSRFPDNARTRRRRKCGMQNVEWGIPAFLILHSSFVIAVRPDAPVLNLPVRALFPRFQPRRGLSFTAFGRYLTPSTQGILYRTNPRLSTADFHAAMPQFMAKPIHVRRTIHGGSAVNSCAKRNSRGVSRTLHSTTTSLQRQIARFPRVPSPPTTLFACPPHPPDGTFPSKGKAYHSGFSLRRSSAAGGDEVYSCGYAAIHSTSNSRPQDNSRAAGAIHDGPAVNPLPRSVLRLSRRPLPATSSRPGRRRSAVPFSAAARRTARCLQGSAQTASVPFQADD